LLASNCSQSISDRAGTIAITATIAAER